eukprot:GHRR01002249.1.p1 GENE.GHRR01002249.1~~GHRR01002249.1.p1  ORF type:complete len:355 (+),score=120.99 GHRR01002249.1:291-1355(+)
MTEPHRSDEHWVAQEGAFSAATSNVPVLHYFPTRGRAEPIRLALALVKQPWFEPPVGPLAALVRHQLDSYPFRQMPRFVDEVNAKVDIVQSMAILRHLGRKYGLYGSAGDLEESAAVDMILDAVTELRAKLKAVVVDEELTPKAVSRFTNTVLGTEQELLASDEPGPGLACLERLLAGPTDGPQGGRETSLGPNSAAESIAQAGVSSAAASGKGTAAPAGAADAADSGVDSSRGVGNAVRGSLTDLDAVEERYHAKDGGQWDRSDVSEGEVDMADGRRWFVGENISIADIVVADLVDLHLHHFEDVIKSRFPHLCLHRRRVMGQPGIRDYLASNNRHKLVWGRDWSSQHAADTH